MLPKSPPARWAHQQWRLNFSFLLVLVGALLTLWPLLQGKGYPFTHSYGFNMQWSAQYGAQVMAGQFYPRWLEQSWASLGQATFSFYGPICMVATLPFAFLGWTISERLVGSLVLAVLMMGIGSYLYAQRLFPHNRWLWGIVGFLAMESPYFVQNVYVRGAMGEMWAMVTIPWILWAGHRCVTLSRRRGPILVLALAYGMLVLCHPPSLLMFSLVWLILPLLSTANNRQRWIYCLRLWGGAGMGLAWTSFYLFPAFLDQQHVQTNLLDIAFPNTRQLISGLLRLRPQITTDDYDMNLVSTFWFTLATLVLTALLLWLCRVSQPLRQQALLLVLGCFIALLMTTDVGNPLYIHWPTLSRIQFAWRWLAVCGALTPFLLGISLDLLVKMTGHRWRRQMLQSLGIVGLAVILMASWSTNLLNPPFNPSRSADLDRMFAERPAFPDEADLDARPIGVYGMAISGNADGILIMGDVREYVPVWAPVPNVAELPSRPLIDWGQGSGDIKDVEWKVGSRRFQVNVEETITADQKETSTFSSEDALLRLRMFAWPGWHIRVNGERIVQRYEDGTGLLVVPVPMGESTVTVRYGGTLPEQMGWGSSFAALLLSLLWWQWPQIWPHLRQRWQRKGSLPSTAATLSLPPPSN